MIYGVFTGLVKDMDEGVFAAYAYAYKVFVCLVAFAFLDY